MGFSMERHVWQTQWHRGAYAGGTIFSLSVGFGPFVKTNPEAGKVGATVGILGTDLTGATGVKFNGTETAFRVVSSYLHRGQSAFRRDKRQGSSAIARRRAFEQRAVRRVALAS